MPHPFAVLTQLVAAGGNGRSSACDLAAEHGHRARVRIGTDQVSPAASEQGFQRTGWTPQPIAARDRGFVPTSLATKAKRAREIPMSLCSHDECLRGWSAPPRCALADRSWRWLTSCEDHRACAIVEIAAGGQFTWPDPARQGKTMIQGIKAGPQLSMSRSPSCREGTYRS
jgi:hypothetical protein